MLYMAWREGFRPPHSSAEIILNDLVQDFAILSALQTTRYLQARNPVPKAGNLHLAWEFARDPNQHHRFIDMLRVSPRVFLFLVQLIQNHPVFSNNSNVPQAPVDI